MARSPCFLGIDIGTTSTKAVVYDPLAGRTVRVASRPTPVHHPRPEWAEWDPEALWNTVVRTVQDVLAQEEVATAVAGIGIACVGEAGVLLDGQGRPLRPIIAWFDPRGEAYVDRWWREVDTRRLYLITGHFPRAIYTAFKLLWLQEHEPEVMARLAHWLFVGDYIAYRLTGEMRTVPTLAARSYLFDVVRRDWHDDLLSRVGLRRDQMPPVIPATEPVGRLRPDVARLWGVPAGLPVALGGHDHVVGMWLAGIDLPRRAVDSTGTAQGVAVMVPTFVGERGYEAQLTCYPMAVGPAYILQGGMPAAGAALQWLADLIAGGDVKQLLAWAAEAPPGSGGTGALPFLRGAGPPYRHVRLRGLFYQVDLATRPQDLARSLVEGLACFTRDVVELLAAVGGIEVTEVRAIGGVHRHPLILQIKASLLNRPFVRVAIPEVVGTGAALVAALAAGYFSSPDAARASVRVDEQNVLPVETWRASYEALYRRYRRWVRAALDAAG